MTSLADAVCLSHQGVSPLVISLPHIGTELPARIAAQLTARARRVEDTDWHVDQLYAFAKDLGASWVAARYSRYVVDLNRPPDNASLYPGQATTGLVPIETFDGESLYEGLLPDTQELQARLSQYWAPYHAALQLHLADAVARHGYALLLDCHSIRSHVPRLFEGRLPDINLGTNDGASCLPHVIHAVTRALQEQTTFSFVLNGRFKGGYITRHYGNPKASVSALQIELAQSSYMDETGNAFERARALPLIHTLQRVVSAMQSAAP